MTANSKKIIKHKFNEKYFDVIDDEHKAYWLGFIWGDGYLGYRIRDNCREEYNLKISLMEDDYHHLEKLNIDLDGNYEVKYYNISTSGYCYDGLKKEARLFITNKHMGKVLRERYGIIPRRTECDKIISNIPDKLIPHFIRGVVDADGTFCHYFVDENGVTINKYAFHICGSTPLLRWIEKYFIHTGLINDTERKLYKRHEGDDRDKGCRTLVLSGKNNVSNVLNHIYKNADVYLDRKYEKYLNITEVKNEV